MIASHRADEITYYEELGVAPAASSEEIRDAFRTLVRLLHPDQQTDAQLKDVAEKQMRKLNRIYAVLSDPERRRLYDEVLDDDGPEVATGRTFKPGVVKAIGRMGWVVAILLSAGLLIWLASEGTPGPQSRVRDQNGPTTAPQSGFAGSASDQESLITSLRSDLSAVTRQRDAAIRELSQLRGTAGAARSTSSASSSLAEIRSPAITLTELPSAAKLPVFANYPPSRPGSKASPDKLAGFWFYAKPPQGQYYKSEGRYPPEYIEATISERNGTISGKYRARFHIADREISPDVNFTFTGASSTDPPMTGIWTGAGGAKGKLTLRFTSANSLRIDWNATELGTRQGLDADTEILTRRIN
jgi:curved DNA-binding protein CbpA